MSHLLHLIVDFILGVGSFLLMAVGLGFVIFVHELGHFAVAKWVGVLVERFSIGFGPVLWSRRWGETEYALSAIPFGGYVKMLGQDDNPANAQRERERSMLQSSAGAGSSTDAAGTAVATPAAETDRGKALAAGTSAEGFVAGQTIERAEQLDPHSYQAKSVPQRMAIISAGVVMNIIFGFLFFILVFNLGVPITPPIIGYVEPASPAWLAGIERGDRILEVNGEEMVEFEQFQQNVMLSAGRPLEMLVARDKKKFTVQVTPRKNDSGPQIGVNYSQGLTLDGKRHVAPGLAAGKVQGEKFESGDRITHVDGVPVKSYAQFVDYVGRHAANELRVSVERAAKKGETKRETAEIVVPPQFMRTLGLRLQMGRITAMRPNSPAERAGLIVGDIIQTLDSKPFDPLRLPDLVYELRGRDVEIEVRRVSQGEQSIVSKTVRPDDEPGWQTPPGLEGRPDPLTVPALGITYQIVPAIVEEPDADSPAAKAGLRKDDVIISATLSEPAEEGKKKPSAKPIPIKDDSPMLPAIFWALQHDPKAELTLQVSRENTKVKSDAFSPALDPTWPAPFRGLHLTPLQESLPPQGLRDAVVLGYKETRRTFITIYLTLRRLATRDVSPKNLIGPLGIAAYGYHVAATDYRLLIKFLALLSVNLAIVNFLPIPVLDGGHMFFLAWEGVRGKPPSERVHIAATWAGLVLILLLAILVTGQDIWRFILRPIFEG